MNRKELLKHYYNDYSTRMLKNCVSQLLVNRKSINDLLNIEYRENKENFLIIFYVVEYHEINKIAICYQVIDTITDSSIDAIIYLDHNNLQTKFKNYKKFEDEELNRMLISL